MIRLEKMDDFFAARVYGYENHMRTNIEGLFTVLRLVDHEMELLRQAGFSDVRIMKKWGESTYTVLSAK